MMFTRKYKSMNEQISPSQELVNKMISSTSIDESPKTAKKSRKDWKFIIKFALPALMVLSIFCFQMFSIPSNTKNGNWFSLVVYADENIPDEIAKEMKITLEESTVFGIEGENIKSVTFESKNASFIDFTAVKRAPDLQTKHELMNPPRSILTIEEYISEAVVCWIPGALSIIQFYNEEFEYDSYGYILLYDGDYKKYLTDTVTITVLFDDGEVMTQVVEITIDENTGETFAQIIE